MYNVKYYLILVVSLIPAMLNMYACINVPKPVIVPKTTKKIEYLIVSERTCSGSSKASTYKQIKHLILKDKR